MECISRSSALSDSRNTAIRFLVEAALQSVASEKRNAAPQSREEWVDRLCSEVMSDSETSHQSVIAALMATGVSSEDIFQTYVPAVARRIGELWVQDKATFVQVTLGAGRLQALFQNADSPYTGSWLDRTVPLGQSILMILPEAEDHTLGAFVAADQFRRHGIWVRVAIRLKPPELLQVIEEGRFSMLGMSIATAKSLETAAKLIEILRSGLDHCPPIVIGGKYVMENSNAVVSSGATYAVRSAREAIEKCGLATVNEPLSIDSLT